MKFRSRLLFLLSLLFISVSHAQNEQDTPLNYTKNLLGFSVQVYPAGFIPTINLEHYISERSSLLYRLGGNFTDRQDFSDENDLEEGAGFGGSFGYRKHYPLGKGKIIAGFNTDVWNLWIDWRDNVGTATETSGTTYTFVVQPWLEAGYFFNFKNSSQLGFTAGFGREINVITNGEDVAQDFIGSISIQYYFGL